ncbi:hypothetical protein [Colwellia sp. MEBiC06753]
MKHKTLRTLFYAVTSATILASFTSQAGLVKSSTSVNLTQRTCTSVADDFDGYIAKWGDTMSNPDHGFPFSNNKADLTPADACIFNTQWEVFFEGANPGTKISMDQISPNISSAYLENDDGDIWLQAELDDTELALPEAHFVVNADYGERNSANLFSAQSYLWSGETTTLEFSANFDFALSNGAWGNDPDSFYILQIGASQNMTFGEQLFPEYWGESLDVSSYLSAEDNGIVDTSKNYRNMTISFEVNNGDEFQLWGLSQAFALNGGWVDSANTMTTSLGIKGIDSDEEVKAIFASSLSIVSVPEPPAIALMLFSLIVLLRKLSHQ